MRVVALCGVLGLSLLGSASGAGAWDLNPLNWSPSQVFNWQQPANVKGNDTGGIIPWTAENEAHAQDWAGQFCKMYDKYPRITGVHRQYGDYTSFNCLWTPDAARFALPEVRTRHREALVVK